MSWLLAVTVAALSGRLMARWTLRPVAQAAKAARDLSGRLLGAAPAPAGDDEVDSLTLSLSQLAEALEAKIDSLQAAAARERRFTSDVAHELRTPLTALRSAATLLEDELGALPARGRRPAQLMVDGVRRLESLVDELLQLARLDAGHEAVELEPLALGPALEAASGSGNGDGRVEIDVEGELCVLADRARLRRVVANLVTNARRHGGGDPLVRARRAGSWVVVDVVDQGPGIGEQHLGRIFDRFYKADTARSAGGSGLGLAIARENARLQGGTLEARNRDGGGACFTLRLPVAEVAPTTPPQDRGEPRRS
ncbi:MAG: sensor histidine kinase [Acidimicrobiia bacterium]